VGMIMTKECALNVLEAMMVSTSFSELESDALQMAVNALDYAIHVSVEPEVRQHTYWCGKCGNHLKVIGLNIKDNYCGRCGTPVLWKGDENE